MVSARYTNLPCGIGQEPRDVAGETNRCRIATYNLPELAKTLLEVEVLWDDGPLRLFATHLGDRFEEVTRPCQAQVQAILGVLRAFRAEPHLLVGDFKYEPEPARMCAMGCR